MDNFQGAVVIEDMELISIIIPVYNVEEYIDCCLRSVVGQTYKNLEIIIVDDGSTDSSYEKCNKWSDEDFRVRVIHQSNGGLSDARNRGLAAMTGEYFYFVDSDDWIEPETIEVLYGSIKKNNADIISGSVKVVDQNGSDARPNHCDVYPIAEYKSVDALESLLYHKHLFSIAAWGKLYRASVIKQNPDISFPTGLNSEDYYFLVCFFTRMSGTLRCESNVLYNYRKRKGSITACQLSPSFSPTSFDNIEIARRCRAFLDENDCQLRGAIMFFIMQADFDFLYALLRANAPRKYIRRFSPTLRVSGNRVLHDSKTSFGRKLKIWFFPRFPHIYFVLSKFFSDKAKRL